MAKQSLASGLPIARLFGITVRIHVTWILIFLLLTFSLASELLPLSSLADGGPWWNGLEASRKIAMYMKNHPGVSEEAAARRLGLRLWPWWQYWLLGAVGSLGLFVCVLAHELSHSLVARQVGIPVEGITLFIFGGMARIGGEAKNPGDEFKIAAAGPLMSLAIGLASGLIYWLGTGAVPEQARALMFYFMFINLALMAFNLVPGFPLDGGRLLRAALWTVTGDYRRATWMASWAGRLLAMALISLGVLEFFLSGFGLGALWWVIIGLFLWQAAKAGYQQVELRQALAGLNADEILNTDVVAVEPDLPLERLVQDYFYRYRRRSFPVVEDDQVRGLVYLKDVRRRSRTDWQRGTVAEVMRPVEESVTVHPHEDMESVFRKLTRSEAGRLPVVEDGRLVGVVTREDLMNLLQIRTDLGHGRP